MGRSIVIAVLAPTICALAACGGGGGSSTLPSASVSTSVHPSATASPTASPTPAPTATPTGAFPDTNGLYDLQGVPLGATIPASILNNPNIDGVTFWAQWATLEPSDGVFSWSALDATIAQLHAAGKKFAMNDPAGHVAPSWLYSEGVPSFSFVGNVAYNPTFCTTNLVPIPWDPTYQSKLQTFIQALAAHVAATPVDAQTLTRIHIEGVNYESGETGFPVAGGGTAMGFNGQTCTIPNENQAWIAAGYTRTKAETAWETIAQMWANAFPNVYVVLNSYPLSAPPIDQNGNLIPGAQSDLQFTPDLVQYGTATFGQHFIAEFDGLSAIPNSPYAPIAGAASQVVTGYQMLWYVTNDSTCRMTGRATPCDPATTLQTAVNEGIAAGAHYLEIYDVDVQNPALASIIASTHAALPH